MVLNFLFPVTRDDGKDICKSTRNIVGQLYVDLKHLDVFDVAIWEYLIEMECTDEFSFKNSFVQLRECERSFF